MAIKGELPTSENMYTKEKVSKGSRGLKYRESNGSSINLTLAEYVISQANIHHNVGEGSSQQKQKSGLCETPAGGEPCWLSVAVCEASQAGRMGRYV